MNDQIVKEAFWSDPFSTLLQQAVWLDWLQALLYIVLAIAIGSLFFSLLDMALLCWKEFYQPALKSELPARLSLRGKLVQMPLTALRMIFRP